MTQQSMGIDGIPVKLERAARPLTSKVSIDGITADLVGPFDYHFDGTSSFHPFSIPAQLPERFQIGVIVGASGSGKSTMLRSFGHPLQPKWEDTKTVASHFGSASEAAERLMAAGMMSVPDWVKPYKVLSTGQRFRADLARQLDDNAVIDEFTSVVDRNVAKSAATAASKFIRRKGLSSVVFATCHRDIVEWLEPDWIIDTDKGELQDGRSLQRPDVVLEIHPAKHSVWRFFAEHHYLSGQINKATHCYVAVWQEQLVGFYAVMTNPAGTLKNAWRGHRLVVLPDYQGLGIGPRLSEAVADHYVSNGCRFFAKTAHPRLGSYRDSSDKWRATSKNHRLRSDVRLDRKSRWHANPDRWTFSHEYIGSSE